MNLKDKVAIVTGGSEGLGLSIVKKLISEGCSVHIISRTKSKQEKVVSEISNENLFIHQSDVSNYGEVLDAINSIGDVDILINNAGLWLEGNLESNEAESISKVIDVNVKGVIYSTKAVLPVMKNKNDGYILNVSSTSGLKGREGQSVYVASKFAVTGFTESLKEDLKATNIKVVGFYPGGMNTTLFEKAGFPKKNSDWMDTEKVADIIVSILKIDDSMILDHVVLNKRNTMASN
jgi:3-oxoacyl-[acyl-carrier protein] reductase